MIYFLSFIFIITIPIFLHELGHFMAARSVGIKVEKFYIGMNLFGLGIKKKIKGTEYGIGLFPLGGYVKVAGIIDESLDSDTSINIKEYEFRAKNVFQKLWFLSAGVLMNFILSIIIFTTIFFINGIEELVNKPIIGSVQNEITTLDGKQIISPATKLGLKAGDQIIEINNIKINNWNDIGQIISNKYGYSVNIKWKSNNIIKNSNVFIVGSPINDGYKIAERGVLGIIALTTHSDINFIEAIKIGSSNTLNIIVDTFYAFVGIISGNIPLKYISGIVGIANIAGETAQQSQAIEKLFYLMAFISANLGLINILPIPGLDGGHAAIAIVEGIIRKELPLKVKYGIQLLGLIFILLLFTMTIYNDIIRL